MQRSQNNQQQQQNPEIRSDYSKVAGYKVNIQKSISSLYTNNVVMEFDIKNIIPFILVLPKQNTQV